MEKKKELLKRLKQIKEAQHSLYTKRAKWDEPTAEELQLESFEDEVIKEINKLNVSDFKKELPVELILEAKVNELVSYLNNNLYSEIRRLRFEVKMLKKELSKLTTK